MINGADAAHSRRRNPKKFAKQLFGGNFFRFVLVSESV
jgi:hypothetical protein